MFLLLFVSESPARVCSGLRILSGNLGGLPKSDSALKEKPQKMIEACQSIARNHARSLTEH